MCHNCIRTLLILYYIFIVIYSFNWQLFWMCVHVSEWTNEQSEWGTVFLFLREQISFMLTCNENKGILFCSILFSTMAYSFNHLFHTKYKCGTLVYPSYVTGSASVMVMWYRHNKQHTTSNAVLLPSCYWCPIVVHMT